MIIKVHWIKTINYLIKTQIFIIIESSPELIKNVWKWDKDEQD